MKTVIVVLSHFYGKHGFSDRQLKRMNKAISIFHEIKADYLIGTGGFGFFNSSNIALGKRTAEYFKEKGITKGAILYEDKSKDTIQNLRETLLLVNKYRIEKVIMVTSWDHMFRARFLAKRIFPKNIKLDFVVSDYVSTWKVTIWDFFWHLAGWVKLLIKRLSKV